MAGNEEARSGPAGRRRAGSAFRPQQITSQLASYPSDSPVPWRQVILVGQDQSEVLDAVLSGRADVGCRAVSASLQSGFSVATLARSTRLPAPPTGTSELGHRGQRRQLSHAASPPGPAPPRDPNTSPLRALELTPMCARPSAGQAGADWLRGGHSGSEPARPPQVRARPAGSGRLPAAILHDGAPTSSRPRHAPG